MKKDLKPLKEWICDKCGEIVSNDPDCGYVLAYYEPGTGKYRKFSIIHKNKCDDGHKCGSWALEDFSSRDGLSLLLELLHPGPIVHSEFCSIAPERMGAFVDLARRLFVPYYEEARQFFNTTSDEGNGFEEYTQEGLKRIIEEGQKHER